jgi:hypothetical protein
MKGVKWRSDLFLRTYGHSISVGRCFAQWPQCLGTPRALLSYFYYRTSTKESTSFFY